MATCIYAESKPKDLQVTKNPYQDTMSWVGAWGPIRFSCYAEVCHCYVKGWAGI